MHVKLAGCRTLIPTSATSHHYSLAGAAIALVSRRFFFCAFSSRAWRFFSWAPRLASTSACEDCIANRPNSFESSPANQIGRLTLVPVLICKPCMLAQPPEGIFLFNCWITRWRFSWIWFSSCRLRSAILIETQLPVPRRKYVLETACSSSPLILLGLVKSMGIGNFFDRKKTLPKMLGNMGITRASAKNNA